LSLDAPVKDETGLATPHRVDLDWGWAGDIVSSQAALLALLPEKGFRLRSEKVSIDVMVIDSAEKPKNMQRHKNTRTNKCLTVHTVLSTRTKHVRLSKKASRGQ